MKPLLIVLVLSLGFTACAGSGSSPSGSKPSSSQAYLISTVAGGGPNHVPAVSASMFPSGVATDAAGNVYISSFSPLPVVFRVDTHGTLTIVAGNGFDGGRISGDGGPATQASFTNLYSIAVDSSGNIYIVDVNRIREVVAKTGIIQTVAGKGGLDGYSGDGGKATQAKLANPAGVAVDNAGNIFIADSGNGVIREVLAASGIIQTVAGGGTSGLGDGGPATQAFLGGPPSVAIDGSGNIFIDSGSLIREVGAATGIIQTVAGGGTSGLGDGGPATRAEFSSLSGLTVDSLDNIFIADTWDGRIREVVAGTGIIQTVAGGGTSGYSDGVPATQTELDDPSAVAVDSAGNLFISALLSNSNRVRKVAATSGIIDTLAGDGSTGGSGNAIPASDANLANPGSVFVDGGGNIFIADDNRIREVVATTGIIKTVAGNRIVGYSGDGGPATQAELSSPQGVAVDNSGDIFIADAGNFVIREVVAATGMIQTVAGIAGTSGYSGDGGPATQAELGSPAGLFVDGSGNLFIADGYILGCATYPEPLCEPYGGGTIRKIDAKTGNIQTVAGNGTLGYSGDSGPATQAELYYPDAVFVDASGNTFISDFANQRIREVIAATGVIQTVAGSGAEGYSGDGGKATEAKLKNPDGVWLDSSGNIFIADRDNNRIREVVAATGIIQTVAGTGIPGYSGDGGQANQAELGSPVQVVLDSAGAILFVDQLSHRIRKLTPSTF